MLRSHVQLNSAEMIAALTEQALKQAALQRAQIKTNI